MLAAKLPDETEFLFYGVVPLRNSYERFLNELFIEEFSLKMFKTYQQISSAGMAVVL